MFGILGPLRVTNAGQGLRCAGHRPRAVLAALVVEAGRPVGLDRVVDAVWGERPPPSAIANVHTHVSRLRRQLAGIGLPGRIVTESGGYLLDVESGALDFVRFEKAAARARGLLEAGDPAGSVAAWEDAFALWRGSPLEDVSCFGWLAYEAARLEEVAVLAHESFADARLAAGHFGAAITELTALVRQAPLREGLWHRLVLAQHRAGRRAEALETYRALRAVLVEALGVEPCEQIRELHQEVLRGGPAGRPSPMQLPPDVADLTGREAESAELEGLLARPGAVAAITGAAGVGKTALATRVAHEVSGHFGGGQLYVRLGGAGPAPRDPAEVLTELLTAFGVHPDAVPEDVEARAAVYRSQLAARQVLVVLDDAASAAQVRPLLPGTAGSAVLITSRAALIEPARTVRLGVLGTRDAVRLLAAVAGEARVAAEPDAAAEIARCCGHLPLALRIAGTRLARRAHWTVARLAARLADEGTRLDELRVDDLAVRASLASGYEALDEEQRRTFRLLSLLEVRDFPGWAVAPLLGVAVHVAEELVDSLVDAHLLESADGRYRFPELLRIYGRERAREHDAVLALTALA
ncbi:AfsR/SARP family transcriptional regulator [Lentzea jiangxiensis]|uniref:DNA-binding transcriptional activator of the SARP family n=1 Tax=Lentzea jiangxiensis TaxID=641025 RepID=A0A1H0PTK7_9PSEU|nr:AfsR/SARP family transcriptional regulator [Lentzea jiangxiensis]SDP08140.1 DNA-binding transcriptional activator of the SARP family [Lentzea jiangxiensis]